MDQDLKAFAKAPVEKLLEKAQEIVRTQIEHFTVFDNSKADKLPHFECAEIVQGRVLGRGAFCVIQELTEIRMLSLARESALSRWSTRKIKGPNTGSFGSQRSMNSSEPDMSNREHLARRVWSKQGSKYVVKHVSKDLLSSDRVTYLKGVVDLVIETNFLASLKHHHIIQLQAISCDDPFASIDYFIVLDQLVESLPKRLNTWMHTKRATRGVTGLITGSKRKSTQLLTDRLLVAYDIAEAMDYLHGKRVIHRDLKPDNLGFDASGVTKLFDFGLATQLTKERKAKNGLYLLTGQTGAIRYMAPEVGLCKPYNQKADVYSWSMIMWYILALEPPMCLYTPNMFIDRVFQKGYRPATKEKWSEGISELLKACWSDNLALRPAFQDVMIALRSEVTAVDPKIASLIEIPGHSRFLPS